MHKIAGVLLILAGAACSRGTDNLGLNIAPDAGVPGADAGRSNMEMPSDGALCDAFELSNLRDLRRLGLLTSQAIVEGRLSEMTVRAGGERAARLLIDQVYVGSSFMLGAEVTVHFDEEDEGRFPPGEYIFGFSGNEYPVPDESGGASWWSTQVIVPRTERSDVLDLLRYRAGPAPFVAVVELSSRDEDRAHFRVVEALRGELPAGFSMNWSARVFAVSFPQPGPAQWIMSLRRLDPIPGDLVLGTGWDFRPASDENLETVRTALLTVGEPSFNPTLPRAFGEKYRSSWRMRSSEHVLTAHPTGFTEECCTGAGGTYVEYQIDAQLQGQAPERHVVGGGHGSQSDEVCGGEGHIFGVARMDGVPVPEVFSCGRDTFTDSVRGAHFIRVDLPNTSENLAEVEQWLRSPPPYYQFGAVEPRDPRLEGVWSTPVSVENAVYSGELTLLRVEAVEGREIRLETTFYAEFYDHLEKYRTTLSLECGDPRLFEAGEYYYGFVTWDELNYRGRPGDEVLGGKPFLVPGVLLPYESWAGRTAMALESLR